jgi:hypothetical protein
MVDITAGTNRKETVRGSVDVLFDPELDRLILRFEGLLTVCKLLEQRGATDVELGEHRRELERGSRRLASLVGRAGAGRPESAAA